MLQLRENDADILILVIVDNQ